MGSVARLYAELGLEDREFRAGMTRAKEGLSGLVGGLGLGKLAVMGLGGAMTAVGSEIRKAVTETVQYNKSVRELASITRLSTEETSRIIQVADDWGISIGEVRQALQMATKNGFAPSISALAKLADHYVSITDPTKRAAEMTKIFGRNWAAIEPILAHGGQALLDNAAAINKGLIVTQEAADASREFEKATDDLSDAWMAFKTKIGNDIIPALTKLIRLQTDPEGEIRRQAGEVKGLGQTYQTYINPLRKAAEANGYFITSAGDLYNMAGQLVQRNYAYSESLWSVVNAAKNIPPDWVDRMGMGKLQEQADGAADAVNSVTLAIKDMTTAQIGKQMLDDLQAFYEQGGMSVEEYKKQFVDIATGYLDVDKTQAKFSVDMSQLSADLADGKISWDDYTQAMKAAKQAVDAYNATGAPQAGTPEGNTPGRLLTKGEPGKHAGSIQNDMDAHAGSLERGAAAAGDLAEGEGKFAEHVGTLLTTLPPVNAEMQTMHGKFTEMAQQSLPTANTEMGNVAGGIQNMRIQSDMTIPKLAELQGAIDALHGKSIVISVTATGAAGSFDFSGNANGNAGLAGNGKKRAAGGPVTGGSSYLVGENGPELFVPQRDGQIISNGNMKGIGGGFTLNNYGTLQVKGVEELTTPRTRRQQSLGAMR